MLYHGTYEGGCYCGSIRYAFTDVFDAGYCHCSICRRTTGAPVLAFANTLRSSFRLLRGHARFIATTVEFRRAFCQECGTMMWSESTDPLRWNMVSVHHGTIDQSAQIEPAMHICHADRLPWFHIDDTLARADDAQPPHPATRREPRGRE